MKRIYSIIMLFMFLYLGTSCEDDYHDVIFFSGDKPIFEIGTCTNQVSDVTLYISNKDGIVIGIDGGDGNYTFSVDNNSIVKVEDADNEAGYRRICIKPQMEGDTFITATDGSGNQAVLRVSVTEPRKQFIVMSQTVEFVNQQLLTEEATVHIVNELLSTMPVKKDGGFEIFPDMNGSYDHGGELRVYGATDADAGTFLLGTYVLKKLTWQEKEVSAYDFSFGGKTHTYMIANKLINERSIGRTLLIFREDVTSECGNLPAEVAVCRSQIVEFRSR